MLACFVVSPNQWLIGLYAARKAAFCGDYGIVKVGVDPMSWLVSNCRPIVPK
jgi:hypothetical protein